jgi:integrase
LGGRSHPEVTREATVNENTIAPWTKTLPKEGFTDSWLTKEAARRDAPRREVGDRRSGLRALLEPSGRVTWVYYERLPTLGDGKPKRKKHRLGVWPHVTIDQARERVALIKRSRGTSVGIGDLHPTSPFRLILEQYISGELATRRDERKAKSRGLQGPAEKVIRRFVMPALGARPTVLIQTKEVAALVESVAKGDGHGRTAAPTQAKNVLSLLNLAFGYAATIGIEVPNPCAPLMGRRSRKLGARPGLQRERCLTLDEVPLFWNALASDDAPMIKTASLVGRLLLLTGARKGELLKAKWKNVQLEGENPTWFIPGEDRKTGKSHTVALSNLAVSLFQELLTEARGSEYVCATTYSKGRPLAVQSLAHAFKHLFTTKRSNGKPYLELPGGPVVPHDMRRTAKMLAARCDAKADWAEQEMWILGHAPPSKAAAHYDIRPDPVRLRAIMESLSQLVLELVNAKTNNIALDGRRVA